MTPYQEAQRAKALTLTFDVVMAWGAMAIGIAIPLWLSGYPMNYQSARLVTLPAFLFAASAAVAFYVLRVHRQVWRHSGWPDAMRIVQAVILSALIFLPLLFLITRGINFPRSSLFVALPLWLGAIFLGRMIALSRSTRRPFQIFSNLREDAPGVLIVGDGESAAQVLRDLRYAHGGSPVRALGLIEATGAEPGRDIRGVPVLGGMNDLGKVLDLLTARYGDVPWVAAVGEARDRKIMNELLLTASSRGAKIMALGGNERGGPLQEVATADLLARPERQISPALIESIVKGAHIMVTGAGGTIGGELARQCAELGPEVLTLYDASEYNLYRVDLRLREQHPNLNIVTQLGDVRDAARLEKAMIAASPDIVIHAAALKHVPLMEANPNEAILTNVRGAMNAAHAAVAAGAKRFVFISTDKAVDPDNVMGATKRVAEICVRRALQGTPVAGAMVRFGNVLGSSGSVVPLFERQIARGGPVTVTDKDVTRYFMTVQEASKLVLHAGALQEKTGEASLFLLDMGEPIKIEELAEAMIRMKGFVPGEDIKIIHTGLRPGESLHESLTYSHEKITVTAVDGVQKVIGSNGVAPNFDLLIDEMIKAAKIGDTGEALRLLSRLVPEYQPDRKASFPTKESHANGPKILKF